MQGEFMAQNKMCKFMRDGKKAEAELREYLIAHSSFSPDTLHGGPSALESKLSKVDQQPILLDLRLVVEQSVRFRCWRSAENICRLPKQRTSFLPRPLPSPNGSALLERRTSYRLLYRGLLPLRGFIISLELLLSLFLFLSVLPYLSIF